MRTVIKAICLLIGLAAILVAVFLIAPGKSTVEFQPPERDIQVVAHRGAAKWAPENTLAAIEKAIQLDYAYVELDVRYTRDRVPVIMHDDTVDRTTNGSGLLNELTLAELQQLDAGSWFGEEFVNARVPTLAEVLAMLDGRICVLWDAKEVPDEATVELFRQYGFERNCLLVSFGGPKERDTASALLRYWPKVPLLVHIREQGDLDEILAIYPRLQAVKVNRRNVTAELINAAHEDDVLVVSSALMLSDHPKIYARLVNAGLDVIMVDHLDEMNEYLATGNTDTRLQDFPPNSGYYKNISSMEIALRKIFAEIHYIYRMQD